MYCHVHVVHQTHDAVAADAAVHVGDCNTGDDDDDDDDDHDEGGHELGNGFGFGPLETVHERSVDCGNGSHETERRPFVVSSGAYLPS